MAQTLSQFTRLLHSIAQDCLGGLRMYWTAFILLLPFLGTVLGSAGVFLPGMGKRAHLNRILTGFAAGVMVAASIWSLILPAIEQSRNSFLPAVTGVWAGFLFLFGLEYWISYLQKDGHNPKNENAVCSRNSMLVFAVSLHNLPEGMAVGVAAAGYFMGEGAISLAALFALSAGIAIQNIPEGAIISMPLCSEGTDKGKSFWYGALSGAIEPIAALLTILTAAIVIPMLPYCLCFAAGAMLYVVVDELIPGMTEGTHCNWGVIAFCVGFTLMMALDVALG